MFTGALMVSVGWGLFLAHLLEASWPVALVMPVFFALHGWVYKIGTGEVFAYDTDEGQFRPLADVNANSARIPERRVLGDELGA